MEKGPSILFTEYERSGNLQESAMASTSWAGLSGALAVSEEVGRLVGVSGSMLQRFMGGAASFITAEAYLNSPNKLAWP